MAPNLSEFIDIHCHILPGLDDGPKEMRESMDMARCYQRAGVKQVVATPHFLPGTAWSSSPDNILEILEKFRRELQRENIDLTVYPGMEIGFHLKIGERLHDKDLLPLGDSGHYLIEPSFYGRQEELVSSVVDLLQQNFKLILAHPERVDAFQNDPESLIKMVALGLRIQVNAGSLLGRFGSREKRLAGKLYQWKCLHFLASDAHNSEDRPPLSADDWRKLSSLQEGEAMLQACLDGSTGLLSGKPR